MDCYKDFNVKIKVIGFKKKCKYHKKKGEEFHREQLTPSGLCLHAFHAAYPYCLGLLYDIKNENKDSIIIKCPNPMNTVTLKVYRIPNKNIIRKIVNILKTTISKLTGFSADPMDKYVYIEILENNKCPKNYSVGQTFEFNLEDGFCPASFDAIYSSILSQKTNLIRATCPSMAEKIIYEISEANNG